MNNIFDSKQVFQIWIYTVSHSILILRSPNNSETEVSGCNIDIEFWGVSYLDIPDMLTGVYIKEVKEKIPVKFKKYTGSEGCKLFEIQSGSNIFYIVAAGFRVGKNNWDNENRVVNPNLEYDELIAKS